MRTFQFLRVSSHRRNEILEKQQDHRLRHDDFEEARRRYHLVAKCFLIEKTGDRQ
jgi:hypothetical protein